MSVAITTAEHFDCYLLHPTTTEFSKTLLVPAGCMASELPFRVPSLFPSSGKWNIGLFALGPRYTNARPRMFRKILKCVRNWLFGTSIHYVSHTCYSSLKFCENLVSARVPSHFKRSLLPNTLTVTCYIPRRLNSVTFYSYQQPCQLVGRRVS